MSVRELFTNVALNLGENPESVEDVNALQQLGKPARREIYGALQSLNSENKDSVAKLVTTVLQVNGVTDPGTQNRHLTALFKSSRKDHSKGAGFESGCGQPGRPSPSPSSARGR